MNSVLRLFFLSALLCWCVVSVAYASAPGGQAVNDGAGMAITQGGADSQKTRNGKKQRQPHVEIWLPPEFQSSERQWPVLIYSHDFGGCGRSAQPLMQFLADQGYLVLAPDHADANCRGRMAMSRGTRDWPEKPFRTPEAWSDKTESDRKDDVLFALSSMLDDRRYKNYVDLHRVGLIGHGLGGYTVLGIAGAWPSWKDRRFKAVLAFSPYVAPYLKSGGIRRLEVPVMYQGGTLDKENTPSLRRKNGAYEQTTAPKYFIELEGASHAVWADIPMKYNAVITKTALQFFTRHISGDAMEVLPEGEDKPGRPVNKVQTFWIDEGDESLKN